MSQREPYVLPIYQPQPLVNSVPPRMTATGTARRRASYSLSEHRDFYIQSCHLAAPQKDAANQKSPAVSRDVRSMTEHEDFYVLLPRTEKTTAGTPLVHDAMTTRDNITKPRKPPTPHAEPLAQQKPVIAFYPQVDTFQSQPLEPPSPVSEPEPKAKTPQRAPDTGLAALVRQKSLQTPDNQGYVSKPMCSHLQHLQLDADYVTIYDEENDEEIENLMIREFLRQNGESTEDKFKAEHMKGLEFDETSKQHILEFCTARCLSHWYRTEHGAAELDLKTAAGVRYYVEVPGLDLTVKEHDEAVKLIWPTTSQEDFKAVLKNLHLDFAGGHDIDVALHKECKVMEVTIRDNKRMEGIWET